MTELRVKMDLRRVAVESPADTLNLFRLGTSEVERLIEDAPRNTDDNARVEFAAPRTFGKNTLPDNVALIHRLSADPLDHVVPAIEDTETRNRLYLKLAQNWIWRGDWDLALSAAERVPEGPQRERAEAIIAQAKSGASGDTPD